MKGSGSDCGAEGEGKEWVLIRSDPNYVPEIELHIEKGGRDGAGGGGG